MFKYLLPLAFLLLSASAAEAATITLKGEVTYRERIALPRDATLTVRLIDLTNAGAARAVAGAAIASPGQVPLTFTLNFDDGFVVAGHDYALIAEISAAGELWFRNSEPYALDSLSAPSPIVLIVNFAGRIVENTPATPEGLPKPPAIIDITWRTEAIDGHPALDGVVTTLSIAGDMRAGGRGGCNSYFAQAKLDGESLRFSAIAATRMACASTEITLQEEAFFAALGATRFWRLTNGTLSLRDGEGRELLRFVKALY